MSSATAHPSGRIPTNNNNNNNNNIGVKYNIFSSFLSFQYATHKHTHKYLRINIVYNIYLLTHSMVQSPSWEANWFSASQEIPRISRNPKVHYRTHKRPPPVSILDQPNPVHITTSHLLEIRPNIIHPSTSRSPQWSPSFRFPHQDPIHPPLLAHTRHMPSPSMPTWRKLLRIDCHSGWIRYVKPLNTHVIRSICGLLQFRIHVPKPLFKSGLYLFRKNLTCSYVYWWSKICFTLAEGLKTNL